MNLHILSNSCCALSQHKEVTVNSHKCMFWCHLNSDSRWNGGSIVYPVKYWISGFHLQDIKPRKEPLDKNKSSSPLMINQRKSQSMDVLKIHVFFLPLHFISQNAMDEIKEPSPHPSSIPILSHVIVGKLKYSSKCT